MTLSLWMRHEVRGTEHRAPIVPRDAARLVSHGVSVTVEDSPQRIFAAAEYAAAGCAIAAPGSWVDAPADTYVIGLKELPTRPAQLRHRHVFFSHAYKGQLGSAELLHRFQSGGGAVLDLEYLADDGGRRLAAFGYWAGYAGAALAVLHHRGRLTAPVQTKSKQDIDRLLARAPTDPTTRALVIGALGRCGRGARDALRTADVEVTCWDLPETRSLDRSALLGHALLVNAVLSLQPVAPFVTAEDLTDPARVLTVIADITCDVQSPYHALPIYRSTTTWAEPVNRLSGAHPPLDVIAIDNLPAVLPHESSTAFSADLLPHLLSLDGDSPVWRRCLNRFHQACRTLHHGSDESHV